MIAGITAQDQAAKRVISDMQRKAEALASAGAIRIAEPTLTNEELSETLGALTARFESLHAEFVALEAKHAKKRSIKRIIKAKLRAWLAE